MISMFPVARAYCIFLPNLQVAFFLLNDVFIHKSVRLKKINHMSQSCRAHLFFGARLIQQNPRFEIFLLAYFFFPVFYELSCQNIQEKI